jgi:hypothetical protein
VGWAEPWIVAALGTDLQVEGLGHVCPVDEGEVRGVAVLVDAGTGLGLVVADEKATAVLADGTVGDRQAVGAVDVVDPPVAPRTRKVPSERFPGVVEYTA